MTLSRLNAAVGMAVLLAGVWLFGAAKKDNAPPSIAIISPQPGGIVDGPVNILFQTQDNVTAVRVMVSVDGQPVCDLRNSGIPKAKGWTCFWESALETEKVRTVEATAYDAAGNNRTASIQVTSAAIFRIVTLALPTAICGEPYSATIQATGGLQPYQWSSTDLPPWLSLQPSMGAVVVSGIVPVGGLDGTCGGTVLLAGLPLRFSRQ